MPVDNAKEAPARTARTGTFDALIRRVVVGAARRLGYDVWRVPTRARGRQWRDSEYYRPMFSPWLGYGDFGRYLHLTDGLTLVPADRLYGIYVTLSNALALDGEVWEAGVYKGGTARMMAAILANDGRTLRLFDSFTGLPGVTPEHDLLRVGAFGDTSVEAVQAVVGSALIHEGLIPATFAGLEASRIAFAHVDVDLYRSVRDCCEFIYPRLVPGGTMVFDDYGGQTTPGARVAVDEFFADKPEMPLVLPSGQAIVTRNVRPS